jgi:hypothetical protein
MDDLQMAYKLDPNDKIIQKEYKSKQVEISQLK